MFFGTPTNFHSFINLGFLRAWKDSDACIETLRCSNFTSGFSALSPPADGWRLTSPKASINLTVGNASLRWYSCIAKVHPALSHLGTGVFL